MFALMMALIVGLVLVFGAMVSTVEAAPLGGLKQYRVPTADSQPRHVTVGSDGNLWFTEGNAVFPNPANVGRITPSGEITEFPVCLDGCLPNDIVQGPGNVLYFTQNDPGLGRITTSGEVLPDVAPVDGEGNQITNAIGNGIAAAGGNVWYTDFNNDSLWRYNTVTGQFTQFEVPTPNSDPFDVAVASDGTVWFTEAGARAIGRLDPTTGAFTETPVPGGRTPRSIAIATDGSVWFTERFDHRVGRLDPATNQVTEWATLTPNAGPEDIVAAPNGAMWFTQFNAGNVARITSNGTISEGRSVKNSGPFGVTIGPNGRSVWYTMLDADRIAVLKPR